ncbi:hypothetical protein SteCoe_7719 [Stentor coeruleus]|uniref:Uncharacterized protein n=1 Tax=Stentor coeruleus TaxID=5963 RepID=A0A1R2CLZ7_9CILI|nr:hypothetical protein SteCoe_7719 [Stentor coeruleus]
MAEFPYDKSWFITDLFFGWTFKAALLYQKCPPNSENLFQIPQNLSIKSELKVLKGHWKKELLKPKPNFAKAVLKTVGIQYICSVLLMIFGQTQTIIQAVLLNYIVDYLMDTNAPKYQGALLIIAFILSTLIGSTFKSNSSYRTLILTGKLKNMIAILVSEKVLKLQNRVISEDSLKGKILNTISTDMELLELMNFTVFFWAAPFVLIFAILVVSYTFGPIAIIGLGISVIHVPFVFFITKLSSKYRTNAHLHGDLRIKMIQNLIEGIKIIKLYAWELPFLKLISDKRKQEIKERKIITNFNGILQILSIASIPLLIFISLLVQVSTDQSFTPGKMFLVVNVFFNTHIIIVYINSTGIGTIFVFLGIMKRTGEILLLEEYTKTSIDTEGGLSIYIKDLTADWKEKKVDKEKNDDDIKLKDNSICEKHCLENISFKAKEGELIVVVGPVGSGKTSLLMSLLGEMINKSGSVSVKGKIAFASQEPWIISGSVKENIIMGRKFDEELYEKCLSACDLNKDLEIFHDRDETLVGDRGFTLSGGQRARVNLARAAYSKSDIYLLDDPLSAVDPEVANHIFNYCVKGVLAEKTIVLVTHQIQFLSRSDKILVLDSGQLFFYGSYSKLKKHEGIKSILGDFTFHKTTSESTKKNVSDIKEETKEKLKIEEEEISQSNVSVKSYYKYLIFGFKSFFFILLFFLLLIATQMIFQAFFYLASLWSKQDDQYSLYYIQGMGILVMLTYIGYAFRIYSFINILLSSNIKLHNKALKSIALTQAVFYDKNPTGRIINRFSKDIGAIDGPLQYYFYESISTTALIVANIIIAIIVVPYNLAVLPFWLLVCILLFKYITPIIIMLRKLELIARGPLLTTLTSTLAGLPTIRSLKIQKKFKKDIIEYTQAHYRAYITFHTFLRFNQLYADLGSSLIAIINAIVIIGTKGYIEPSLAAYSLSSCAGLLGLTSNWSKNIIEMSSSMSSAQRLMEYANIPSEDNFHTKSQFNITSGCIEFSNVCMKYRPNLPYSLYGLTFKIKSGHKVGILGRTGAGKSSILQVLFRLTNPEKGTIFIDSFDYMQAGLQEIRNQISVIPQSATLFSTTIRDNLDPFHLYTDQDIIQVLEDVQLKDKIMIEKNGINAEVRSGSVSLSAGEMQLLCMARAILRKNKIIMMDEATANVDNETDRIIQETIKNKFEGCTLLVIAHRIRTVIKSDRVMIVDKGMCVEYDKPRRLLKAENSMFKNMVMQTGKEEAAFLLNKLKIDN